MFYERLTGLNWTVSSFNIHGEWVIMGVKEDATVHHPARHHRQKENQMNDSMQMKQSNDYYQFRCPLISSHTMSFGLFNHARPAPSQSTRWAAAYGRHHQRQDQIMLPLTDFFWAGRWMNGWMDCFGLHVGGYSQWSTHGIIRICSSMSLTHCLGSLQSSVECTLNPGLRVRKTAYTIHHETVLLLFFFFLFLFFVMDRTGSRVYSRFLLFFTSESCT